MKRKQALEGIKVVDFSWVGVGPAAVRYLADHGATVIRVESSTKPDTLRTNRPFKDDTPHIDGSGYFANYNAGKYGISLNLSQPKGVAVARRLVLWADVVVESYTSGVMRKWGLDYESLRKVKPDLIMASTCQQGQIGPYARFRGYGPHGASLAGFFHITGWPDGQPTGPYGAYTDFISHRFLILALLTALDYRRRTGKGQYIDQSQCESGIQFLAPAILDYTVNGRVLGRVGNRDPRAAPHAAYRCRGEDRWCAIAVFSDEEWQAFCRVVGKPEWTQDPRFATLQARKENEEELNRLVEEWTLSYTPEQVMTTMQSAGVAAGVVQTSQDLHQDPQLEHRHHFWVLPHKYIGPHTYDAPAFRLSKTPHELRSPAPCMGEHNEYVLREILGLSDEEIAELVIEGVLE